MSNGAVCSRCSQSLDGSPYASIGGNWEPYVPAKLYHIQCVPTVQELCPNRGYTMKPTVSQALETLKDIQEYLENNSEHGIPPWINDRLADIKLYLMAFAKHFKETE